MHDGMTLNDLIATNAASTVDSMRIVRQLVERGLLVASPEKTNQAIAGLGERTG
jgi:pullulanase/glycogen debranching enzyme